MVEVGGEGAGGGGGGGRDRVSGGGEAGQASRKRGRLHLC